MRWQRDRVLEAIASPDLVQRGDYGAMLALRHYNQPPAVNLFVVAVYPEIDVLYLSQDEPRQAIGVDAGEGLIFRYDEATVRPVGLTIVGVRARLAQRSAGR